MLVATNLIGRAVIGSWRDDYNNLIHRYDPDGHAIVDGDGDYIYESVRGQVVAVTVDAPRNGHLVLWVLTDGLTYKVYADDAEVLDTEALP